MFDNIQVYTGNVIGDTGVEHNDAEFNDAIPNPQTPDEVIEYANREAENIKTAARDEAIAERDAILESGRFQAEQQIAENVANAMVSLRMELLSSKVAMGEILATALDNIVGSIGHDRLALSAVEKAISDYGRNRDLIIYGNSKTLERLRLVAIGSKKDLKEYGVSFKLDAGLSDGRCILAYQESRVEIGLEAQLGALKKVFHADGARAQKTTQAQLMKTGKLM